MWRRPDVVAVAGSYPVTANVAAGRSPEAMRARCRAGAGWASGAGAAPGGSWRDVLADRVAFGSPFQFHRR